MKDPYMDDLGLLLNELDGPDLDEINNAIFKDGKINRKTNLAKRCELSAKIKSSYRHSFNLTSSEHEPDWRKIVIETIKKLKIKLSEEEINSLSILELEGKVFIELIEKTIEKNPEMLDKLREEFIGELSRSIEDQQKKNEIIDSIKKMGRKEIMTLMQLGFLPAASSPIVAMLTGSILKGAFSLLGYNALQGIIMTIIIKYFGYWAGIKAALGIGTAGTIMTLSSYAGPVGIALGALLGLYILGDTSWSKVIPAVMVIGFWRMKVEYERKQKEKHEQGKCLLKS